ncbi:MAG: excinuclease ABC subunit UvrA [Prevotellaceae bacterium]|jgi:excinuclease ABC subunit A|nr:excinuclease ABC subunit UvrA [Prevotellaceae bacterium]
MPEPLYIEIEGARVHNLKNVSLNLPRNALTVITGLSGSGKSSLAFDTLYAEGQRRYLETLSVYARQFMGTLERPDVDYISGLSPIIAIEQKATTRNQRSTVGTITEINDFLRLLFARASLAFSPVTGEEMIRYTQPQITETLIKQFENQKILILAPLVKGRKGHYKELFEQLTRKGFTQVRIDGTLQEIGANHRLDRYKLHFIEVVIDKVIPTPESQSRLLASVSTALHHGKGTMQVVHTQSGDTRFFSAHLMCPVSGLSFTEPAPHHFSFNSPQGACPHCKGLGVTSSADINKIIPDMGLSIAQGGIRLLGKMRETVFFRQLDALSKRYDFSLHIPISQLPEDIIQMILYGSDELIRMSTTGGNSYMTTFSGVINHIENAAEDTEDDLERIERFLVEKPCPTCHGSRLKEEALCFKIDGKNIADLCAMDLATLSDWFLDIEARISTKQAAIAHDLVREIRDRLHFLSDVGLEYLSLSRSTRSLSGGESQRIRLATQIGSKLVNVLYILDEPSIGLHQRDNQKLIKALKRLRDDGNSVLVVEHDEEMIRNADWIVDMGPGAGQKGGEVIFSGCHDDFLLPQPASCGHSTNSLTYDYLKGIRTIPIPTVRHKGSGRFLRLTGACGNNLKSLDVSFPLGCLIGITGVSGSGKSSLITDTLMPIISQHLYKSVQQPLSYTQLEGIEHIDKLVEIDQSPIGRTPRSNPATYTHLFADIRKLFEETPDAKVRGFKAGRFSFNVKGGRCEECRGAGVRVIEMNFLPNVHVPCRVCNQKRYNTETLAVRYKGKTIADVLDMTIQQSALFFEHIPMMKQKIKTLMDVGLGYVTLGQPSTTLSGGECQRVKLAGELSKRDTGNTLYILDEPTTGLHFDDIRMLLEVLQKLVSHGNTVIIIEHNLDVIKNVDWVIDLGPNGGAAGGEVVAAGTPEALAKDQKSFTGRYLTRFFT